MPGAFRNLSAEPQNEACRDAYSVLTNAHRSARSFIDFFNERREGAQGVSSDPEQDLLRAMFLFAGAGLDATFKQLIKDALPRLIHSSDGVHLKFREYVERQLKREPSDVSRFLADVISRRKPFNELIQRYIDYLCSESLQSADQVFRIASCFDIPSNDLYNDARTLRTIFSARNQIIHELDVHLDQTNRSRRQRKKADMVKYSQELLAISDTLVRLVDERLSRNAAE